MPEKSDETFETLVAQFLGKPLSPLMAKALTLSALPPDTQAFIRRALALMQRARYAATDFNPALIRWLSVTVPGILPSAWGGRIPPLTLPRRHRKLDDYVASLHRETGDEPPVFVDVGCGFPPVTAADTAKKLADWQVYGVDNAFDDYVLYDPDGHYACFDEKGAFQYFQALMNPSGRALYANPQATRDRFVAQYEALAPLLQNPNDDRSETVEKDDNRLIHHHIRDFKKKNLTLVKADITQLELPAAKAVRCMNVLTYFDAKVREKVLTHAGNLLADDGILIAGTNGLGIQSRYAVYRKGAGGLNMDEFAFGLENVGHIVFMPFFTIHENDPEAQFLAELTGAIRADASFWPSFSARQDALLKQHGLCERGVDGYLQFLVDEIPPAEYLKLNFLIWQELEQDGFLDGAVDALARAGYDAWKNPVGDVAVRPSVEVKKNWK